MWKQGIKQMNSHIQNGSSLIMSKFPTLSPYTRSMKDLPSPRWEAVLMAPGMGTRALSRGLCCTVKHKSQPCGLQFLPLDRERSRRTHTRRCGSCPRENTALSLSLFQGMRARGWERHGQGQGDTCRLVLYDCFVFPSWLSLPCYYPWLQDIVFVTKTLFPCHNLEKGHLNGT